MTRTGHPTKHIVGIDRAGISKTRVVDPAVDRCMPGEVGAKHKKKSIWNRVRPTKQKVGNTTDSTICRTPLRRDVSGDCDSVYSKAFSVTPSCE